VSPSNTRIRLCHAIFSYFCVFWTLTKRLFEWFFFFFSFLHYLKTAIKTPTRTLLCCIGDKPIILSLPYN
jgi:hypothetical protein